MPLSERRECCFNLAADFLFSIVVAIDFMTFQTIDIQSNLKKLVGAAFGGASMRFGSIRLCRYRQMSLFLRTIIM